MKRKGLVISMCFVLGLLTAGESMAQGGKRWRGSGGQGPGMMSGRIYNSNTVETISGKVVGVETFTPTNGRSSYGIHLMVQSEGEVISVHMGPGWYIENQGVRIKEGDEIVVKGSRITFEGSPAIVAAEIKKGDSVLTLRDANGFPLWSGGRGRGGRP